MHYVFGSQISGIFRAFCPLRFFYFRSFYNRSATWSDKIIDEKTGCWKVLIESACCSCTFMKAFWRIQQGQTFADSHVVPMDGTHKSREEYISKFTVLPIGFTEVTIYDFPGEEYAFRRRKHFSVVVSWSTPFHGRERPTEKSLSVVVRQQAEGLVVEWK